MTFRQLSTRGPAIALAVLLTVLGTTSTAFAYWTAGAAGTAEVGTATLSAPTGVQARATGATVTVAWDAPTIKPAGVTTLAYRVIETTSNEVVCSIDAAGATPDCAYTAGAPGAYTFTVTAVLNSWTATSAPSNEISVSAATAVTVTAGAPQSARVSTAFATALEARVTDRNDHPVSGLAVTFTAPGTGASGTFPDGALTTTVTTNGRGVASAPTFTANSGAGSYVVAASVAGVTATGFTLTNTADPANAAAAGSTPGPVAGPAPVGNDVAVTVTDPDGGSDTSDDGVAVTTGPQVTSVSPSTIARGTSAIVTVSGIDFGMTTTLSFGNAGITTGEQSYSSGTGSISVTVTVGEVPLGDYDLTVTNADGGTTIRPAALTVDGQGLS
jgi:adhesin/invasin